jgi:hypothetical protein
VSSNTNCATRMNNESMTAGPGGGGVKMAQVCLFFHSIFFFHSTYDYLRVGYDTTTRLLHQQETQPPHQPPPFSTNHFTPTGTRGLETQMSRAPCMFFIYFTLLMTTDGHHLQHQHQRQGPQSATTTTITMNDDDNGHHHQHRDHK